MGKYTLFRCCLCNKEYIPKGRIHNTINIGFSDSITFENKWICGICRMKLKKLL